MMLIADSGSTKTNWCHISTTGHKRFVQTGGLNPFFRSKEEIFQEVNEKLFPFIDSEVTKIHFYGAGIVNEEKGNQIKIPLLKLFTGATVFTESDLLASARATLAGEKGIACILGTGSNSCYYDGEKIQSHVPPLGFILGDEGSGAVIGRKLVGDYLKNLMPGNLKKVFGEKYPLTYADFLNHVYRLEKPNKFLAEFVPFLSGNIENDYCSTLIKTAFSEFIVRNVAQYERHTELPISFTGSVAYHFRTQLLETLEQFNLKCVAIVADPMEGLIHFHKKNG